MNAQIIATIISGVFSIISAFGAILLKDFLDRRRAQDSLWVTPTENPLKPPEIHKTSSKPRQAASLAKPTYRSPFAFSIPVATVVVGAIVGIASRLLRPYANVGGIKYDALGALAVLTAGCLVLVIYNRNGQGFFGHVLYQLENFALWSAFACAWSLIDSSFPRDVVDVSIEFWFCCSVLGSVVLLLFQWRRRSTVANLDESDDAEMLA